MSDPVQSDYGRAGSTSELVPNGLRVYRHYNLRRGMLASTIMNGHEFFPGVNTAECFASDRERADQDCKRCLGWGKVDKDTGQPMGHLADRFMRGFTDYQPLRTCDCLRTCNAPDRRCTCGFYASYDPQLDFFQEYIRRWFELKSGHPINLPHVFAVVEASGRVLMGSKGVRAERMRVVALAVDVHHVSLECKGREFFMDTPAAIQDAVAQVGYIAPFYGATFYGTDRERMVRDYPQPDLSNLIHSQERSQHG